MLKHIPDIRPQGTPTVHRFGNPEDLKGALAAAGFVDISVRKFVFDYDAGRFSDYWSDYMATTASAIRTRIEARGERTVSEIRAESEEKARKFMENGGIRFPWDVLVATAANR